jgi:hypothetical protein
MRTHTIVVQVQTEKQTGQEPTHNVVAEHVLAALSTGLCGRIITHRCDMARGDRAKVKGIGVLASGSRPGWIIGESQR